MGSFGQSIKVKNEATKEMFEVTLTGPQAATMGAAPTDGAALSEPDGAIVGATEGTAVAATLGADVRDTSEPDGAKQTLLVEEVLDWLNHPNNGNSFTVRVSRCCSSSDCVCAVGALK